MTLLELKKLYQDRLNRQYESEESLHIFLMTIAHFDNWSRLDLALQPNLPLTKKKEEEYLNRLSALENGTPVQHLIGHSNFLNLEIEVSDQVLIPRPETEELVQWIAQSHQGEPLRILDIGTGSGCIALGLKHLIKDASVTAIDKSQTALDTAKRNAVRLDLDIEFGLFDITKHFPDQSFDLIVSNPPYVRESEKVQLRDNVLLFEPEEALFVDDNEPLYFYELISEKAGDILQPGGWLYFEINEAFGKESIDLLKNKGFCQIELKKDMFGKDRMIKGVKN